MFEPIGGHVPPQLADPNRKYLGAVMANRDDASEPKTAVSINPHICHCSKRCTRKRQRKCLPQEMFLEILLRLPAQVVHNVMKHVCREWNLMISAKDFIQHHLQNSTRGIIIQEVFPACRRDVIYVEMRRGCLEICKFDYGFEFLLWTSCNGLVVARDLRDSHIYYVTNPLTKWRTVLPPNSRKMGNYSGFGLAFVEASMKYKVVYARGNERHCKPTQMAVLTIGVDKVWRHIDIGHSSLAIRRTLPLVTGGYVHWMGETFVLTLNVESETIRWFPLPPFPKRSRKFLPMGCNLSFLHKTNEFMMEVWEMNPETGEWTMILRLDLEPLRYHFKDLCGNYAKVVPFGWLAIREVLVFSTGYPQTNCVAYNVKTREIQSFELGTTFKSYLVIPHVSSLVCLEG
ncbi:putative F-box/kelch-repeat protein At1g13200 isoform X2 [Henckelia pumila]|uniref:putative F-box/kelch-repeat protein At1g13200 isoform X2 n=2 Tax=Henckelia pumila TaxID=405737 RepID=UPI003C6E2045